jgi:solute:Na+ symporter, SSS family
MLRLHPGTIDYVILAIYFVVVLGIGFVARLSIKTDLDFFLSGRSLPAWITGLAFIAANLGALEILGQAANGAQYGVPAVHYYWIGAVPAMVFLGLFVMPFSTTGPRSGRFRNTCGCASTRPPTRSTRPPSRSPPS